MQVKKILLLMIIACFSLTTQAQTPNSTSGSFSGGGIIFVPKPPIKGRPKAPSMQEIECSYSDGWLNISFRLNEGMATLYIYDSDQTTLRSQQIFYTDSEASLYVGDLNDAYLLIDTSYGHQYEGWL